MSLTTYSSDGKITGSRSIRYLHGKYTAQILYIVGKGPSLAHLTPSHFGEGPIITINEAVQVVQNFNLPNDIYSMQKDGCDGWNVGNTCRNVCEMHVPMVRPQDERITVILQRPGYSQDCLPDYPNKVFITPTEDLDGVEFPSEMSVVICVEIGRQIFRCAQVILLCFDSFQGNFSTYGDADHTHEELNKNYYSYAIRRLNRIFEGTHYPYALVFPEKETI